MLYIEYIYKKACAFFISPVNSFIAICSFFGILIIVLTPPLTGADEEAHFIRAYGITEGIVVVKNNAPINMPETYIKTLGCLQNKIPIDGNVYNYKYNLYSEQKLLALKCAFNLNENNINIPIQTTAPGYSPSTYLPQIIAILLGKVFGIPIVGIVYLSRLFVLIAYILLITLAIKILPIRKWALVGFALLPISVIQVTNPGGDYMLLGSTAIFAAVIIKSLYLDNKSLLKYNKFFLSVLTVASAFMVLPKGAFPGIMFLPLLFFYGGVKFKIKYKLGIFITTFLVAYFWQKYSVATISYTNGIELKSFFEFPYAFLKTMFYGWHDRDFIYFKTNLGIDNIAGMPAVMITFMNFLLFTYIFVKIRAEEKLIKISKNQIKILKISILFISISVILGSFAAMYTAAFDLMKETKIITGVQARYFYPALLILTILPFYRTFESKKLTYIMIVILGSVLMLSTQAILISIRYNWGIF